MAAYLQIMGTVILMSLAIQARPKFYDERAPHRYKRINIIAASKNREGLLENEFGGISGSKHREGLLENEFGGISGSKNGEGLLENEFGGISGSKNEENPNPKEWNGEIPEEMPIGPHLCSPGVDCRDVELQPNELSDIYDEVERYCTYRPRKATDLDRSCEKLAGNINMLFEVCVTESKGHLWEWKYPEDDEQTYLQCQGLGGDLKKIQLEIRDAKENQLLKELERCQQHNENSPSYQRRPCDRIYRWHLTRFRMQLQIIDHRRDRLAANIPDVEEERERRMV